MHKTVFVYDSAYEIVEPKVETQTVKIMPTQAVNQPKTQTVKKTVETVALQTQTTPKKTVTTTPKTIKTVKTQQVAQKTPVKTTQTTVKKVTTTPIQTTTAKTVQKTTPVQTKTVTQTVPQTTTITEAERVRQETILWNKWRSDLQNQIMADTKLPIVPQGTIFKFSFDVDKYGKVTNVHTWSTTPTYTPYAIQFIAPVIRSYQGRSILNFPAGSNRVATKVEGGWKISTTSKYSTSADYNDSERVTR